MTVRHAYIDVLDASGGHVLALLGLLARIRQFATGRLPSRQEWIAAVDAHIRAHEHRGRAVELFNDYFPITAREPRDLKLKSQAITTLTCFIEECLRGETAMFQGEPIGALLGRLRIGRPLIDMIGDEGTAWTMICEIAGDLRNLSPPWAPGLRLFDWPGVRSGFIAYQHVPENDERGAYLVVRQARGWLDGLDGAPLLARDLMWVRSQPDDLEGRDRRAPDDLGRYYSAFNSVVYQLDKAANAGDWHRLQGPPIGSHADLRLELEIACPKLETIGDDRPVLGLMSAHTKEGGQASVWKTLILKLLDWPDLEELEAELEMFGEYDEGVDYVADDELIEHLVRRGVIGVFPSHGEADPSGLFRRLTSLHDRGRVRELIDRLVGASSDPIETLMNAWHELESTHIILPPAQEAWIEAPEALALFGREALGPDRVVAAVLKQQSTAKAVGVA